jgi:hypothetical protein
MRPAICTPGQGGDALHVAGERLDQAAAELDRLCGSSASLPEEAVFGRAEAGLLAAREAYRRLIVERLGEESESIARRLAL